MFNFKIMIRRTSNTQSQKAKVDALDKLVDKIGERFDPMNVCFQDQLDAMAEWFHPSSGKIKIVTHHWDESMVPASGLNLIVSAKSMTMKELFLINRYLKKDVKHG